MDSRRRLPVPHIVQREIGRVLSIPAPTMKIYLKNLRLGVIVQSVIFHYLLDRDKHILYAVVQLSVEAVCMLWI